MLSTANDNGSREQYNEAVASGKRPLPPYPTEAPPGSWEKIAVMAWRFRNGYHIHHPLDERHQYPRYYDSRDGGE